LHPRKKNPEMTYITGEKIIINPNFYE